MMENHISGINLHRPSVSRVTELDGESRGVIVVNLGTVTLFFEDRDDLKAFATDLLAKALRLELTSQEPVAV